METVNIMIKQIIVKVENDNDWDYVLIDQGSKKVMSVF